MLISPIKAATGTELQRLQQRRKQVLIVGAVAAPACIVASNGPVFC
jgi:hypothetical protein